MKTCTKCNQYKPKSEFYKNKKNKDGLRNECKECQREHYKKYYQRPEVKERYKEQGKKWYDENRERKREQNKKWGEENKERKRENDLMRKYGLTLEDVRNLEISQDCRCSICAVSFDEIPNNHVCVDHCHDTNKVRGLLCNHCNLALGYFKDDEINLYSAIRYLETSEADNVGRASAIPA